MLQARFLEEPGANNMLLSIVNIKGEDGRQRVDAQSAIGATPMWRENVRVLYAGAEWGHSSDPALCYSSLARR